MTTTNPRPTSGKIQTRHRALQALVYVRQSSTQQIHDHPESRARQYALADHAVALGWPADQVVVIDEDQGMSGQRADARAGFQRLLTDVTLGRVGLILGLEMSRLARSCKDWHQLLEVCALVGTLLADQDGVYDPRDGNDRLLLGLTGIMSEAELVTMRNRLLRGRWNKAERGELFVDPPVGYVKLPTGNLALDPDEQIQTVVRLIFTTFERTGTAYAVVRHFRANNIRIGVRVHSGPRRGQLAWVSATYSTIRFILHHPFYAGAYAYGRSRQAGRSASGRCRSTRPRLAIREWKVLLRDRVPAYITWDQFLANRAKLHANDVRGDRGGAPRPGRGLLTGLVRCGTCGWRLHTTHRHSDRPYYLCVRYQATGEPRVCHGVPAGCIDRLVADLVLKAVEPAALAACLHACEAVDRDRDQVLRVRRQAVERARYDAERAERQFHAVEPENRLVARSLEQQWEAALRAVRDAEAEYDRATRSRPPPVTEADRERVRRLASDVPALWHDAATTPADRKAVVRALIDRVTVFAVADSERVRLTVLWRGGVETAHEVIRPVRAYRNLQGYETLKQRMTDWRRDGLTARQIADRLNDEGLRTPRHDRPYSEAVVLTLLSRWGVATAKDLVGPLGPDEWWLADLIRELGVKGGKMRTWIKQGWLHARRAPAQRMWVVWADTDEMNRLRGLRDRSRRGAKHYPAVLTHPKARPAR
jgi:DNA invertase Pin-like site-specific DNA recombinase